MRSMALATGRRRPMAELSPRELDVVQALLAGHTTNPTIAAHLGITAKTVQTHLTSIFAKLYIFSTLELVLVAVSEGMEVSATWEQLRDR